MKKFILESSKLKGIGNVALNLSEFDILSLIKICWREKRNKMLGSRLIKLYQETCGALNLETIGIDADEVEAHYNKLKHLILK